MLSSTHDRLFSKAQRSRDSNLHHVTLKGEGDHRVTESSFGHMVEDTVSAPVHQYRKVTSLIPGLSVRSSFPLGNSNSCLFPGFYILPMKTNFLFAT